MGSSLVIALCERKTKGDSTIHREKWEDTMQGLRPCSFCNESTHTERRCPELVAPLREEGIQKPSGGRPHGGDDEDDAIRFKYIVIIKV